MAAWICLQCTFVHDTNRSMNFLACLVCGSARPSIASIPAAVVVPVVGGVAERKLPGEAAPIVSSPIALIPIVSIPIVSIPTVSSPIVSSLIVSSPQQHQQQQQHPRERIIGRDGLDDGTQSSGTTRKNAFAVMAEGHKLLRDRKRRKTVSSEDPRGTNTNESASLAGQFTFADFVSPEEEADLLRFLDDENNHLTRRHEWKSSAFNGPNLTKKWGVRTDFANKRFLPPLRPMPEAFRTVIDRMRTRLSDRIPELRNFRPNEANAILYHRGHGHRLGDHCDHRALSGPILVNLSLGGTAFMMYTKDDRAGVVPVRLELPRRSLQVQMGSVRFDYKHGIRNEDLPVPPERRVSITFRHNVSGMGFYDE